MEVSEIPLHRCADALRGRLEEQPPTSGFALQDVHVDGQDVVVVFRWQRDPHLFATRHARDGEEGALERCGTAEEAEILDDWCTSVWLWLMEELDTGFLLRAARHREGEVIVLTAQPDPHPGIWVSEVPQFLPRLRLPLSDRLRLLPRLLRAWVRGRPLAVGWFAWAPSEEEDEWGDGTTDGEWLSESGLDPAAVRALRHEGRLLVWLQVNDGSGGAQALGHCAAVTTVDPEVARLEVLELAENSVTEARGSLVRAAVRAAADRGARTLIVPTAVGEERIDTAGC